MASKVSADGKLFDDFIALYRGDPVMFVRNVLGQTPLPWQEKLLRKIAAGKRRISVRAGHGVGKSTVCAWAIVWVMCTRFPQKAVMTAPTAGQLFDALFSELKAQVNKLPPVLRDSFDVLSDRISLKAAPESSFASARTSSSERPEALAGIHSENVLLIVDEASAVPEAVFEAAAGSMSGHSACTILIGNPTRNSGLFYRTHHELASDWDTMHVSCLDIPLVSRDFVEQIKATYGEGSNAFRIRVLGEFAVADNDTLIAAELVDAAMSRDVIADVSDGMVYGLDVARFGTDRSALCKRKGNVVMEVKSWGGLDLMQLVGAVVNEARTDNPVEICVDTIGLGSGVADRLREMGYNVRDVNVAEASAMNPNANKLRDELWLAVKEWLATRTVKIPAESSLRHELVAPRYGFTSSGKIVVESKDSMKKRGMRSPDLADALCLTFAGNAALVGGRATPWVKGRSIRRGIKGIV
jgi:phage terminase large subunit